MNASEPLHQDPVVAISAMKNETVLSSTIGNIGLNPFFVVYMTPTQKANKTFYGCNWCYNSLITLRQYFN